MSRVQSLRDISKGDVKIEIFPPLIIEFISQQEAVILHKRRIHNATDEHRCTDNIAMPDLFYQSALLPSMTFLILLCFLTKRKKYAVDCCGARPGFPIPMNFISQRSNRLLYVMIFVLTGYMAVDIATTDYMLAIFHNTNIHSWQHTVMKMLAVFVYGTVFYPLLACVCHDSIVAMIIGFIFSVVYLTVRLNNVITCVRILKMNTKDAYLLILYFLPMFLSCIGLCINFFLRAIYKIRVSDDIISEHAEGTNTIEESRAYLDRLLTSHRVTHIRFMTGLRRCKFALGFDSLFHPGVRIPIFLQCTIATCLVLIYTITYGLSYVSSATKNAVTEICADIVARDDRDIDVVVQETLDLIYAFFHISETIKSNHTRDTLSPARMMPANLCQIATYFSYVLNVCHIVTVVITLFINILHIPFVLINYKFNMLDIYKGRYTQICRRHNVATSSGLILGYARFAGLQTAYFLWGYALQCIFLYLLTLFLALFVFVPMRFGRGEYWVDLTIRVWPAIAGAMVVMLFQMIITTLFFTQGRGQLFGLENRNVYFIWVYYLYFYNIFLGVFSVTLRLLKGAICSFVFMTRVDHCVLPKKFEFQDPGWMAYQGYLHVQNLHSNPILIAFIQFMRDRTEESHRRVSAYSSIKSGGADSLESESPEVYLKELRHHRYLKLHWFLLYTLIHNPSMIPLRKHNLHRRMEKQKRKHARKLAQSALAKEAQNEARVFWGSCC